MVKNIQGHITDHFKTLTLGPLTLLIFLCINSSLVAMKRDANADFTAHWIETKKQKTDSASAVEAMQPPQPVEDRTPSLSEDSLTEEITDEDWRTVEIPSIEIESWVEKAKSEKTNGNYAEAFSIYQKISSRLKTTKDENQKRLLARVYYGMADMIRLKLVKGDAIFYYQSVIRVINWLDGLTDGFINLKILSSVGIGDIYCDSEKYDEALRFYEGAYKEITETFAIDNLMIVHQKKLSTKQKANAVVRERAKAYFLACSGLALCYYKIYLRDKNGPDSGNRVIKDKGWPFAAMIFNHPNHRDADICPEIRQKTRAIYGWPPD